MFSINANPKTLAAQASKAKTAAGRNGFALITATSTHIVITTQRAAGGAGWVISDYKTKNPSNIKTAQAVVVDAAELSDALQTQKQQPNVKLQFQTHQLTVGEVRLDTHRVAMRTAETISAACQPAISLSKTQTALLKRNVTPQTSADSSRPILGYIQLAEGVAAATDASKMITMPIPASNRAAYIHRSMMRHVKPSDQLSVSACERFTAIRTGALTAVVNNPRVAYPDVQQLMSLYQHPNTVQVQAETLNLLLKQLQKRFPERPDIVIVSSNGQLTVAPISCATYSCEPYTQPEPHTVQAETAGEVAIVFSLKNLLGLTRSMTGQLTLATACKLKPAKVLCGALSARVMPKRDTRSYIADTVELARRC